MRPLIQNHCCVLIYVTVKMDLLTITVDLDHLRLRLRHERANVQKFDPKPTGARLCGLDNFALPENNQMKVKVEDKKLNHATIVSS